MGAEYYLFAVFVFALALILIVLLVWGIKKNKTKEKAEIEEKEQKVMMLYFEVEDMINGLKEYVDVSRDQIEANIKRIETDMQALSTVRESLLNLREKPRRDPVAEFAPEAGIEEPPQRDEAQLSLFDLHDEGHDVDNIAKKMNLSKTEVAFMLKMNAYQSNEKKDDHNDKKS
jgi:DNA-directed RNA polymerase specialized sigma subunit